MVHVHVCDFISEHKFNNIHRREILLYSEKVPPGSGSLNGSSHSLVQRVGDQPFVGAVRQGLPHFSMAGRGIVPLAPVLGSLISRNVVM